MMSSALSKLRLLPARLARLGARLRPAHLMTGAGVAVLVAITGLQAVALPGPRPVTPGTQLKIELVPPVEPEIAPGSVMEVGELVEGFKGVPKAAAVERVAYAEDYETSDWRDAADAARRPRGEIREAVITAPAPPPGPPERRPGADRWFGFDAPDRDYRAEREMRRARLEARMERERESDRERGTVRSYRSDPRHDGGLDRERRYERDRRAGEDGGRRGPPPPWNAERSRDRWD